MTPFLSIALLGAHIILVADGVPTLDTGPSCQMAAQSSVGLNRDAASCQQDEDKARDQLKQQWSSYEPAARARCIRLASMGGSPSYVELLTCLEMADQVKKLPASAR